MSSWKQFQQRMTNQFPFPRYSSKTNFIGKLQKHSANILFSYPRDGRIECWDLNNLSSTEIIITGAERGELFEAKALANNNIIAWGWDPRIFILDSTTKKPIHVLSGHDKSVLDVYVIDHDKIVSASTDGKIKIWNPNTGECLRTLDAHTSYVRKLYPLSNNRMLSSSSDTTMKVWDTNTWECLKTLEGHDKGIEDVLLLSNNEIMSTDASGLLKKWNVDLDTPCTDTFTDALNSEYFLAQALCLLPNKKVISAVGNTIREWNPETNTLTHLAQFGAPVTFRKAILLPNNILAIAGLSEIVFFNLDTNTFDEKRAFIMMEGISDFLFDDEKKDLLISVGSSLIKVPLIKISPALESNPDSSGSAISKPGK